MLLLTTQSATKIYRTPGSFAEQRMRLRLGAGAQLKLAPDQVIAYREAATGRNAHHPAPDIKPGHVQGDHPRRVAGRSFRYEELRLRTEITSNPAGLLALDNLLIRPPQHDVTGLGFMEGFSHVGSLIVVDRRVDQALADELHVLTDGHDAYTGVSLTATVDGISGLVLRSLSNSTEELNRLLGACSALLRQRWHGTAPLDLRKY